MERAADEVAGARFGALELGGTKALCAVGTVRTVHDERRIETSSPALTLAAVEQFFAPHRGQLSALGIASFGPLELDRRAPNFGSITSTPKPGWRDTPVYRTLSQALDLPTAIDTDVNAAAIAEQRCGAARGLDAVVYITVGTGIGVGVAIQGQPLHGMLHPELGHLHAPPLCDFEGACPYHGRCLEGVASGSALARRLAVAPESLADDHPVWRLEARYLAHLLAACVLAYAPRRIVLGGGVLVRSSLVAEVRRELQTLLAGYVDRPELGAGIERYVVPAHFGQRAGLMGAFLLAEELQRS